MTHPTAVSGHRRWRSAASTWPSYWTATPIPAVADELRQHVARAQAAALPGPDRRHQTSSCDSPAGSDPAEASTPQAMQTGEAMSTPVHYISNRVDGGRAGDGELLFHSDSAARRAPDPGRRAARHRRARRRRGHAVRQLCLCLRSRLPATLRSRIAGARSITASTTNGLRRARLTDPGFHAEHPVVMAHPITGEPILYLSRNASTGIVGLRRRERRRCMEELFSYIEAPAADLSPQLAGRGRDHLGQRCLVHARTAFDPAAARTLQRVTVSGAPSGESVTQAARAASRSRRE